MPITVVSNIVPKNDNTFPVLEDKFLKGGMRVVADIAERDNMDNLTKKGGMYVVTADTGILWQLDTNLLGWTEVQFGFSPERADLLHVSGSINVGGFEDFVVPSGKTAVIQNLSVSAPCTIEAHSTSSRNDSNPYTFISYTGHLVDDGSTLLESGEKLYGRRFTIMSNLETPVNSNTYWRIVNTDVTPVTIQVGLTYMPLES